MLPRKFWDLISKNGFNWYFGTPSSLRMSVVKFLQIELQILLDANRNDVSVNFPTEWTLQNIEPFGIDFVKKFLHSNCFLMTLKG